MTHSERIVILDFGSQYTQLIARKVRELGVYAEIFPYNITAEKLRELQPKGVTISVGGEIGEVGTQNSTVHELRAFMDGFNKTLAARCAPGTAGLSKISVQSGTSHGGVVLADRTDDVCVRVERIRSSTSHHAAR